MLKESSSLLRISNFFMYIFSFIIFTDIFSFFLTHIYDLFNFLLVYLSPYICTNYTLCCVFKELTKYKCMYVRKGKNKRFFMTIYTAKIYVDIPAGILCFYYYFILSLFSQFSLFIKSFNFISLLLLPFFAQQYNMLIRKHSKILTKRIQMVHLPLHKHHHLHRTTINCRSQKELYFQRRKSK